MNNKEKIRKALLLRKLKKENDFYSANFVCLKVGDWVCNEFGNPIGIYDGLNIQRHGYYLVNITPKDDVFGYYGKN